MSVRKFITHHYRHFNSAALIDAARGYEELLDSGGKMFFTMAGAMSTAELGLSFAEMIRQGRSTPSAHRVSPAAPCPPDDRDSHVLPNPIGRFDSRFCYPRPIRTVCGPKSK